MLTSFTQQAEICSRTGHSQYSRLGQSSPSCLFLMANTCKLLLKTSSVAASAKSVQQWRSNYFVKNKLLRKKLTFLKWNIHLIYRINDDCIFIICIVHKVFNKVIFNWLNYYQKYASYLIFNVKLILQNLKI